MKKILNLMAWVLVFPIYVALTPIIYYRFISNYEIRLVRLLTFGREVIGGYDGKLRIGTNRGDVMYQTENFDISGRIGKWHDNYDNNITVLLKMKVYNYWIDEDGYLFIKVYNNERLIRLFNETKKEVE